MTAGGRNARRERGLAVRARLRSDGTTAAASIALAPRALAGGAGGCPAPSTAPLSSLPTYVTLGTMERCCPRASATVLLARDSKVGSLAADPPSLVVDVCDCDMTCRPFTTQQSLHGRSAALGASECIIQDRDHRFTISQHRLQPSGCTSLCPHGTTTGKSWRVCDL